MPPLERACRWRNAAFDAPGTVGPPCQGQTVLRQNDFVLYLRATLARVLEGWADLCALHRLNAYHRRDDLHIQAAIMLYEGPQARRHMQRHDLHHAAQCILVHDRLAHFLVHRFGNVCIRAAHIILFRLYEAILVG